MDASDYKILLEQVRKLAEVSNELSEIIRKINITSGPTSEESYGPSTFGNYGSYAPTVRDALEVE